jgi:hypothetical protein
MDGFSGSSKLKPFLPSISSYRQGQECSQKIETISWSSSEDEEKTPSSNNKKLVVVKLNFEECVLGSSGQIKPRVIRSVNKTYQEVLSPTQNTIKPDDSIVVLPKDDYPVHTPSSRTCTSPIFNYKSNKRKRVSSCVVNMSDSMTTDIVPLQEDSPTLNTSSPKSPIISTRKRKKNINLFNQDKDSNDIIDLECTLTPRPCSPILNKRKINLRRKSSSPILSKSRNKVKRKRMLLDSDAETQVKSPDFQDTCQFLQPPNSQENKIIECSQDSSNNVNTHTSTAVIKAPKFRPPMFQIPHQVLQHGSSQENNIEEWSQDSLMSTTIHCIEVLSSQELEKIKFTSQSQGSQVKINRIIYYISHINCGAPSKRAINLFNFLFFQKPQMKDIKIKLNFNKEFDAWSFKINKYKAFCKHMNFPSSSFTLHS